MSIYGGMFAGVSAVAAQATNFGIIADNIANVNTVGYKDTRARFTTLVTESISSKRYSPGGVVAKPFMNPQKQGLLQGTISTTDVSIIGNGFFVVNEAAVPAGAADRYLFTRAGSFVPDDDGRLVNTAGYFLQGWRTDQNGAIINANTQDLLTSLETVNLAGFTSTANATQNLTLAANLPAAASIGATETTNLTVFDSLGVSHLLSINWTKSAPNTWSYTVDITNSNGTTTNITAAQQILFNGQGQLQSVDGVSGAANTTGSTTVAITSAILGTGANASNITINWGTFAQTNGLAQFADPYSASLLNQDGSSPSALTGVDIDAQGVVTALFANGQTRPIYKIAVATVPAPTQLRSENGNAYSLSDRSGDLVLTEAGLQGTGLIEAQTLEQSTVDLAEEFTDMIITQRAYSAATKLITTGDEMLDEIIRVKR